MRDQTNPMTSNQHEDYYMRWREVVLVVAKRKGVLVCAKEHEGYFRDLIARLKEDNWWKLQSAGIEATMMAHPSCPSDELLVWSGKGKGITKMRAFLGTKAGFGSFDKIMAPSPDGVRDFEDAFNSMSKKQVENL
jgi:hypothetical protein